MPVMVTPSGSGVYWEDLKLAAESMNRTVPVLNVAAAAANSDTLRYELAAKASQTFNNVTLPRYLLLSMFALWALCMVFVHPRFLARLFASLSSPSSSSSGSRATRPKSEYAMTLQPGPKRVVSGGGLFEGWFLSSKRKNSHFVPQQTPRRQDIQLLTPLEEKPTLSFNTPRPAPTPTAAAPAPFLSPPPHLPPVLSYLPKPSSLLYTPLERFGLSHITVSDLYLIVTYLAIIVIALTYKVDLSDVTKTKLTGADFMRSGGVAIAQLPVVVALGVRGNIIGLMVGRGYERLKLFHKIVGRVIILAATLHTALYIHKWVKLGIISSASSSQVAITGYIAWGALIVIGITSIPWVRKSFFGLFEICHWFGMVSLLGGLAWHTKVAVPWVISTMAIYLIAMLFSLSKTRIAHASLTPLPGADTTLVSIPQLKSGWRAGQHVRIRIPGLGFRFGFEGHPFTIATAPDGEGLVLMCKVAGDWTRELYALAVDGVQEEIEGGWGTKATVIIEGPFGGLGHTLLPSFSSVVLISGGSGITHSLSLAHDLMHRSPSGVVRTKLVELVWIVRTEDMARPVMPTLLALVNDAREYELACAQSSSAATATGLRVRIFVTRCPSSSPLTLLPLDDCISPGGSISDKTEYGAESFILSRSASSASTFSVSSTRTGRPFKPLSKISAHPTRPNFDALVRGTVNRTSRCLRRGEKPCGVVVTACGPDGMIAEARKAVRGAVRENAGDAVGGLEFYEEAFGY